VNRLVPPPRNGTQLLADLQVATQGSGFGFFKVQD
jgi:hypothetical protein